MNRALSNLNLHYVWYFAKALSNFQNFTFVRHSLYPYPIHVVILELYKAIWTSQQSCLGRSPSVSMHIIQNPLNMMNYSVKLDSSLLTITQCLENSNFPVFAPLNRSCFTKACKTPSPASPNLISHNCDISLLHLTQAKLL